ncbi:MAG TPA: hypothetical protein VMX97_05760 [Hyphomicrobiaceae bacterium]|nr:hypothetical protein [Hyphomicrobiaceae bacterium]
MPNAHRGLKLSHWAAVAIATLSLSGCGGTAAQVDMKEVLLRTGTTVASYTQYLDRYDYKSMTPEMFGQLSTWLQTAYNTAPKLHSNPIITRLNKDASFDAFDDANRNGTIDATEKRLFKIEIDTDNRQIVATHEGGASRGYRPSGSGFLAGILMGSASDRQRSAGVKPGAFTARGIADAGLTPKDPKAGGKRKGRGTRTASNNPAPQARGRARSGGIHRGK